MSPKNKKKKVIEEAAERLAEILIMQIEDEKNLKRKDNNP